MAARRKFAKRIRRVRRKSRAPRRARQRVTKRVGRLGYKRRGRRLTSVRPAKRQRMFVVRKNATGVLARSRVSKSYGKRLTMNVLRKFALQTQIYRWQNVNPIDRPVNYVAGLGGASVNVGTEIGAMRLDWSIVSTVTPSTDLSSVNSAVNRFPLTAAVATGGEAYMKLPIHCYALNSLDSSVTGEVAGPAYQAFVNLSDNQMMFRCLYGAPNGTDENATPSLDWQLEKTDTMYGSIGDGPLVRNEWYDVNLTLRNATQQATWFDVMLVSFKDDYLDPLESPSDVEQLRARRAFWQGLAFKHVAHPTAPDTGFSDTFRRMRIYKRFRVQFEAQDAQATDLSPAVKVVRMFYRDGATLNYRIGSQPHNGPDPVERVQQYRYPNTWEQQTMYSDAPDRVPRPASRKWLIVSAFDPTLHASSGGESTDFAAAGVSTNVPTYDIIIRRKMSTYR